MRLGASFSVYPEWFAAKKMKHPSAISAENLDLLKT
jgi:hypothetical protein